MIDNYYMKMALKLARKGRGYVSPNPMVGAVLVKNSRIIGCGYHRQFGSDHAEIEAIKNAGGNVAGSTLYVTLEPCCHEGKTPPCVKRIIEHKISKVVIGVVDSNPMVSCQGINFLQRHGIDVVTGVLEDECRSLNETFFHYMETGMPFITLKFAQTIDGRIATLTGESKWISSPASLKFAHRLRAEHDAILVGIGTVVRDNPELTVRHVRGRNPLRIVIDSNLKISPRYKIVQHTSSAPTLIATVRRSSDAKLKKLADSGVDIMTVKADKNGRVDLKNLFKKLAAKNISSVLIEGGSQIITSVLKNDLANRLVAVVAPKILGSGIDTVGNLHINTLSSAKRLYVHRYSRMGNDMIIDARFHERAETDQS